MHFNSNLGFDEIMYRYAAMMAVGITIGVLRIYGAIPFMMLIFITALMGYCPIKELLLNRRQKIEGTINNRRTAKHTVQQSALHV